MKLLTFIFTLFSFICFSQESDKKGIIKVAKNQSKTTKENDFKEENNNKNADVATVEIINDATIPQFPGGDFGIIQYVSNNIIYPPTRKTINAACYVNFVVETDGSLSGVSVGRGIDGCKECDKEAVRLIKAMPKWTPATKNGRAVPAGVTLPIKFKMN